MTLIFSGPSGIGKDSTWIPAAEQLGFRKHLMHTTRKHRNGEINGEDYWFISHEEFKFNLLNGEYLEWEYYFNSYYGMPDFDHGVVTHALTKLASRVKDKKNNVLIISLLPDNVDDLLCRLKEKRGYSNREMVLRKHHIEEEIDNSFLSDFIIRGVENITFDDAVEKLRSILF
jgi:guanylate kinase